MVTRIKYILCAVWLVCGISLSWAQEPITVTVSPVQRVLPPQVGLYLDNPGKYFVLTLKNNSDITQNVYMGMQIEQIAPNSNLSVITPPARMPRTPIIVAPGEVKMLNLVEMKNLFNHLNYTTDVAVRGDVEDGLLAEGTYEARLTAYKWDATQSTPFPLSMPTGGRCQFEVCYKAQAPRFLAPLVDASPSASNLKSDGGRLKKTNSLKGQEIWFPDFGNDVQSFSVATLYADNPIFTWTPPTTNCSSLGLYVYSLKVAILLPGQSPTEAMANGAFYENKSLRAPQCIIPPNYLRRMKEDYTYVAQVTASIAGSASSAFPRGTSRALDYMVIENEGKSEIRLFKFRKQSTTPVSVQPRSMNTDNGDKGGGGGVIGDDGSAGSSSFEAAEKDSLYVFTNPTLTSPKFPEITYPKVFTGEDVFVEWRKAWYVKGEGARQDTVKHKYTVQLFHGDISENRSQTFKKKPLYSHETEELKDTIKWDDLADQMEVGEIYILRVLAKSMNEKSVRYENDSVNTVDFYLANRYTKTREMACPESAAPSNTTPTTSTAEQLKGKTVGMGEYKLTLGTDLERIGDGTFKGKGHIEWNPLGLRLMVAVEFDNLAINTDNVVYEGTAKTFASPDMIDTENVDKLFSEWGVDNFVADLNSPYSELTQSLANDEVGNLAKNLHLANYYNYYNAGKGALSLLTGEGANDVHMPLGIDDIYNDTPVNIQIASMTFAPTRAMMNVIGEFTMPDNDYTEEDILVFGAPMLCISPDRLLPESGSMCLLSHFTLKDPKTNFKCKFVAPTDITNPIDGCYVAWKKDKFEFLQAHVEMQIPNLKKDVGGEATEAMPVLTLKASIHDWDNWMAMAAMDPFQVEDLPGFTFSPGYIVYDHHSEENNELMPMPKDFDLSLAKITKDVEWQGLYMRNMYLSIPTIIEGSGKVDDSANEQVEEIVMQDGQQTTITENKKKVDIEQGHVKIMLKNFYLDASGVSCKAEVDTHEYLKASTNKVGGWAISLDEIYVDVLQNNFKRCGFNGTFQVPLLKNKEGEKATIHYMAGLESYNKNEDPKPDDRLFIFKTWQTEQVSMDFFLADVNFDEKQTFFLVEAEDTKTARVELCLGGNISVSSRIADKLNNATKLGFSLPEMPFTRMRLANCARWKSAVDKNQAQQYQNWVDEWAAAGREDDRTMVSDDKSLYFDIGKWGGASPQKKLGGFSFTITDFKLNTSNLASKEIGLTVGGKLGMLNGKIEVGAKFSIMANADLKNLTLSYKDTEFEEVSIASDFGGVELSGKLEVPSSDEKGYKGELTFKLPGGLLEFDAAGAYIETQKTQTEISEELKKRYGAKVPEGATVDSTYNYCFLEVKVSSKALSSIQPVSIKSIEGGFYWNCRKKDAMIDFSKDNITAQYGMVGGMLGVGLVCGGDNAITANGNMTLFYDMFHDRLSTIKMKADMHAVTNDEGTKGLVNAEATIVYESTDEKKYFEVDVTVDATADMDDAFQQFVGSDLVAKLKEVSETGLSEMGEDSGRNTETSQSDKDEEQKKGESSGHLKAGAHINVNFKITWKENSVEYKNALWHLYVGQPSKSDEQDKRCRITFIDFALGKKTDHFAMWATIYADAYLCFGNELPLDDLPPIPKEISDYLGLNQENLNQGGGDLNEEANAARTKQFSTFKPGGNNGGVAFGAKIYGDMGLNLGLVYARSTAIAGFDVMIAKLKKGTKCIGGGEAGKNGWYGMGQVYALLKGEIGLDIDLWLFRGKIPLVDVGLGALLKAGMPNPTWVYGKAKAHFNLLAGLIKGSATVQLKAGEVCTPEFGNPLDNIDIFGDVSPGDEDVERGWNEDNIVSSSVYPEFNTNMEMDTPFRLLDQNKAYKLADFDEELEKYTEQASRTYRFCLSPDSIRLSCYEPDQAKEDSPKATWDQAVPYNTKNHTIYSVASGSLDYGKLYRLKLSGYAQEWRNGEWGDPFFNDSTTNNKDKRVPWYQTQYYYFRTDPTAPELKDEIKVFHTSYLNDLVRPTFALAHSRWNIDKFDSPDEPVSLRIEVRGGYAYNRGEDYGAWESPSKIMANSEAMRKYDEELNAYNQALKEAYDAAMEAYNNGPLAEYNKKKQQAYKEWYDNVYTTWMDEHYAGWKDWEFIIRKKFYTSALEFITPPETNVPPQSVDINKIEEDIKKEIINNAQQKAEVAKLKESLQHVGSKVSTGKTTGVKDALVNTTTITAGFKPTGTLTNTKVTNTKVTTTNITNTKVTETKTSNTRLTNTNIKQTGSASLRKFHGPMPDMDVYESGDTLVGRIGKVSTGIKQSATYVAADKKSKEQVMQISSEMFRIPQAILNIYNPAKGDKDSYKPDTIVIRLYSDGHEEIDKDHSTAAFLMPGTSYVDISKDKFYDGTYLIYEHNGITNDQWRFLIDTDIPVFTYDVPLPPEPSLADIIAEADLPEVHEPDLQRDMDSESFDIPLEEFTVDTDVKDDYIFLRPKKDIISVMQLRLLNSSGYHNVRVSINRIHKKSYDNLMAHIDELAQTYSTQKAVKLEDQQMGDKKQKGYDSSQAGQAEVSEDGQLNMDAYLTTYLSQLESETTQWDSTAVQRLKRNVDMKDFSTCLYYKDTYISDYTCTDFEDDFKKSSKFNDSKYREFVYTQLQDLVYRDFKNGYSNYTNNQVVDNGLWRKDPYLSFGYWTKWAMIGGYPPYNDSDFPGLQLSLDKPEYRRGNHTQYTDGGHLAQSATGKEISSVANFLEPAMYDASNRDSHRRYTGGFIRQSDVADYFSALHCADCRMAAAIRYAANQVSKLSKTKQLKDIYNNIEKPYGNMNIVLRDNFTFSTKNKGYFTFKNEATFRVLNVPLMIYADYDGAYQGRTGSKYDKYINEGSILRNSDKYVITKQPNIVWRLNRQRAHKVTEDNDLITVLNGGDFFDPYTNTQWVDGMDARWLMHGIEGIHLATYRQNAFHTKIGASKDNAYDVCIEKDKTGNYYIKPDIIEYYDPETHIEGWNYKFGFDIKDIMK